MKKVFYLMLLMCIIKPVNGVYAENLNEFSEEVKTDMTAPVIDIQSLAVSPKEAKPGDTVKISVKITDDLSGIDNAAIVYESPTSNATEAVWLEYNTVTEKYEGEIKVDKYTQSGTWKIAQIEAWDKVENRVWILNKELNPSSSDAKDLSHGNITIVNDQADIKAPVIDIQSLTVSPKEAKPGDTVKISVKITDDLSGIDNAAIVYESSTSNATEAVWLEYNTVTEKYEGEIKVEKYTQSGTWKIAQIEAWDKVENRVWILNKELNPSSSDAKDLSHGNITIISNVIKFSDVHSYDWYHSYIYKFVDKGYLQGYSDGTFRPNNPITRAEFVKVVNRTFGLTAKGNMPFGDVYEGWQKDEIAIGVKAGYLSTANKNFRPNDPITREEASKIVGVVGNYVGDGKMSFEDKWSISDYAKLYVDGLVEAGILDNGKKFRPKDNITRAEAVKILQVASEKK